MKRTGVDPATSYLYELLMSMTHIPKIENQLDDFQNVIIRSVAENP